MTKVDRVECVVCWEHVDFRNVVTCNHGHAVCGSDVERIFQTWIEQPSTTRPRCCDDQLNLRDCMRVLSRDTLQAYHDRLRALADSAKNAEYTGSDEEDRSFVRDSIKKHEL